MVGGYIYVHMYVAKSSQVVTVENFGTLGTCIRPKYILPLSAPVVVTSLHDLTSHDHGLSI